MKAVKETVRKYHKYESPASGYRELTYIQSTGTQYINTGLYMNQNSSIECDYAFTNISDGNNIGCTDSGSTGTNSFGMNLWSSKFYPCYGNSGTSYTISSPSTNRTIYYQNENKIYINNTLKLTLPTATFTNIQTFKIGAWDRSGSVTRYSNATFYTYKIWDDTTLIRSFIPCERLSDNSIGMYDTINNVFYPNAGSGSFVAGDYIIVEGTSTDYDFYEDVDIYKLPKIDNTYYGVQQ